VIAAALASLALAGPLEDGLKAIDSALAAQGGKRVEVEGDDFCGPAVQGPPALLANRTDLCRDTARAGLWSLQDLVASGGEKVNARLGVRRYVSSEAAERAHRTMVSRMGAGRVSLHTGATAWCYADAIWAGELLWTLEFGCHISVPHVPALGAVQKLIRSSGEPYKGAVGAIGSHSGWGWLLGPDGEPFTVPLGDRWWTLGKVVGVESGDVLWIRDKAPEDGNLGDKVSSLNPNTQCVPVLAKEGSWWQVVGPSGVGWASARYLRDATSECSE